MEDSLFSVTGPRVRVELAPQGPDSIIREFVDHPKMFEVQFAMPVSELDEVLRCHQEAFELGLASYFLLFPVDGSSRGEPIGHLRAEWLLFEPGLVALHGGAPRPLADFQAARREAWRLLSLAVLELPDVQALTTCCLVGNQRAERFIEEGGYRKSRRMRTPGGTRDTWHFQLGRSWVQESEEYQGDRAQMQIQGSLARLRQQEPISLTEDLAPATVGEAEIEPLASPRGWHELTPESAQPWMKWLLAHPHEAVSFLGEPMAPGSQVGDMQTSMRFNQRHGFSYYGKSDPKGNILGLVALQCFPSAPNWWRIQGGPVQSVGSCEELGDWLSDLAAQDRFERIEIFLPPDSDALIEHWASVGFVHEGSTRLDAPEARQVYSLLCSDL